MCLYTRVRLRSIIRLGVVHRAYDIFQSLWPCQRAPRARAVAKRPKTMFTMTSLFVEEGFGMRVDGDVEVELSALRSMKDILT